MAQLAKVQYPELQFHLLGYAYRPLAKSVITSGPYKEPELAGNLRELNPTLVWYPCQWPETYSYTLSRVLEGGFPLLIPDLGALVDRTLNRPLTRVLRHPQTEQQWLDAIAQFMSALRSPAQQAGHWFAAQKAQQFYTIPWGFPARRVSVSRDNEISISVLNRLAPKDTPNHRRERLLRILFMLRQLPVFRSLAACIPLHRQRQLKRLLSSKPVHDVVH